MELSETCVQHIRQWAHRTDSVREVWLFGSRAKGYSRSDSDVDLAIYLMPACGKNDWALGTYVRFWDEWQGELTSLLRRPVGLVAVLPGANRDAMVRKTGNQLWARKPVTATDAQGDTLAGTVSELVNDRNVLYDRVHALSRKNEELSIKVEKLSRKNEELSIKVEKLSRKNEELSIKVENLSRKNEELSSKVEELSSKIERVARAVS